MLSNETVRKLHEMRLGVMAEAFSTQLEDVQFQSVSFEDRFAMLVDAEWSARKSNRLTRLIRNAGYADPAACVENIEYHPERRLDQEQILRLASCTYPRETHNVIVLGATGAGKTYLACALGIAASRSAVHPPAGSAGGGLCGPGYATKKGATFQNHSKSDAFLVACSQIYRNFMRDYFKFFT